MNIMIIGAGIVGALTALRLAKSGEQVTLIDKSSDLSDGASGNSFAWLNAFNKTPDHYHDLNFRSMQYWSTLGSELGFENIGLKFGGKLQWENDRDKADKLNERIRKLQSLGYRARLTTAYELKDIEPSIDIGNAFTAVISEIEGSVEPNLVVKECIKRIADIGGDIVLGEPVHDFRVEVSGAAKRVTHVETSKRTIATDLVILTAGFGTTELANKAGINIPQGSSPGFLVKTNPLPQVLDRLSIVYAPSTETGKSGVHFKQLIDGTVVIGEESSESLGLDDSESHAFDLVERARKYLPKLEYVDSIRTSMVYRPMPIDGLPIIGFGKQLNNIYVAIMHSGVTLAPLVSEYVAMETTTRTPIELLSNYRPDRFN